MFERGGRVWLYMQRFVSVVALATALAACTDPEPVGETTGGIQVLVPASPSDVTAIHVSVTAPDILAPIGTDLALQADLSWSGILLDVPPGTGRTLSAEAFDAGNQQVFAGVATNVTVVAGQVVDVPLTLSPTNQQPFPGANTPPHFINLIFPDATLSTEPVTFFAIADDPDANSQLTYIWSVLSGGGSFSSTTQPNLTPGNAVSTVYTPMAGFTGFAVIQVAVTDGLSTASTTFPIAIGAGVAPSITFDVLPDTTITSIQTQTMAPGSSTQIQYTLTNPTQPWTPATMTVQTSWSDSCGGSFDAAPEDLAINRGTTATRTVTYTAPPWALLAVQSCQVSLHVTDAASVQATTYINFWLDPPMVMFVSSALVTGGTFSGNWQNADAFCQNLADSLTAVVPTGTYRALLAFDEINAIDRLLDAPYIRVDGTQIARNKAELYSINLLHAIRTDEHNAFNGASLVYTGTHGNGTKGDNCSNWTSSNIVDAATVGGSTTTTSPGWTAATTVDCSTQLPVYCVQQAH